MSCVDLTVEPLKYQPGSASRSSGLGPVTTVLVTARLDPQSGSVPGGRTQLRQESPGSALAVAPQDTVLFNITIAGEYPVRSISYFPARVPSVTLLVYVSHHSVCRRARPRSLRVLRWLLFRRFRFNWQAEVCLRAILATSMSCDTAGDSNLQSNLDKSNPL
jgi:hypothetical protein